MVLGGLATVAALGSCLVQVDEVGGSCAKDLDCSPDYHCVFATDGGRHCEVIYPPHGDGGDLTGVADYCTDVKPVLDQFCVSCHGVPPDAGSPNTFRLDTYGTTGGIPGAVSQADRIKYRAYTVMNMPPLGSPQPSTSQRRTPSTRPNA